MSRCTSAAALAGLCAALVAPSTTWGSEGPSAADAPARPIVVLIHADWCGTCKALAPTWQALQGEWGDRVQFVRLDVTDEGTRAATAQRAGKLGLAEVYADIGTRSGAVAIVDGSTRRILRVLVGKTDPEAYRGILDYALSS